MSSFNKDITDRLYNYFQQRMGFYDYRNGWMKGDCPICGKEDKFGIHLGNNSTNCFVCGSRPSILKIVADNESLTHYRDIMIFLKAYEGSEYFYKQVEITLPSSVELPDGFKLITDDSCYLGKLANKMVRRRGFKPKDLALKGFGYCTEGKYLGYLIMPFYHNGKLVYFHARRVIDHGPKFNNPEREEVGIGKSMALYNLDSLYIYDSIYMVESVMNAETLGDQGVAGGGKLWSDYQLSLVMRSNVQEVIIIMDPDAVKESLRYCFYFIGHKEIKNIILPEGNDVNDMGKDYVIDLVNKTEYLNYTSLMKMKLNEGSQHTYHQV